MAPKANRLIGALALIAAVGTGSIALQSLYASLTVLPAAAAIEAMRRGEQISGQRRAEAATRSYHAGKIFDRGQYFSDAALAALPLSQEEQRRAFETASVAAIVDDALAVMPASPHNWARRASLKMDVGDFAAARQSLETSLLLGRYVPGLTVPRLQVLLRYGRQSNDNSLMTAAEEQIRIAARSEPQKLARLADGGAAEGVTQRVLFRDPHLYGPYIKALIRLRAERKRAAASG